MKPCSSPTSSLLAIFAAAVAAALLSGCAGDPFVAFSDVPVGTGGCAQVAGAAGSGVVQVAAGSAGETTSMAGSSSSQGGTAGLTPPSEPPETESAGADNAGAAGGAAPTEALELIDDVEGEFPRLPQRDGRTGQWFAAHDDTYGNVSAVSALELAPTRGASRFAAGISGSGYTDWGVQLGVALRTPYSGYDASQYCGVRFLARGTPGEWALLVSDRQTVPEGGICVMGAWDSPTGCYAFVGKSFSVESEWRQVEIEFRDLTFTTDPASGRALDSSAIYDILFHFRSAEGSGFQLLVDDLSFIQGSSTGCR